MSYLKVDLENIIALCSQDENDYDNPIALSLINRCERALVYRDVSIRFTKRDKEFLMSKYDEDMDLDAKRTIMSMAAIASLSLLLCGRTATGRCRAQRGLYAAPSQARWSALRFFRFLLCRVGC